MTRRPLEKLVPTAPEAEEAVLAILLDQTPHLPDTPSHVAAYCHEGQRQVVELLLPADFCRPWYGWLFTRAKRLYEHQQPVEHELARLKTRTESQPVLARLPTFVLAQLADYRPAQDRELVVKAACWCAGLDVAPCFAEHYARQVKAAAIKRELIAVATRMAVVAYTDGTSARECLAEAQRLLSALTARATKRPEVWRRPGRIEPRSQQDRPPAPLPIRRQVAVAGGQLQARRAG